VLLAVYPLSIGPVAKFYRNPPPALDKFYEPLQSIPFSFCPTEMSPLGTNEPSEDLAPMVSKSARAASALEPFRLRAREKLVGESV